MSICYMIRQYKLGGIVHRFSSIFFGFLAKTKSKASDGKECIIRESRAQSRMDCLSGVPSILQMLRLMRRE